MDYKVEIKNIEQVRVAYMSYSGKATEANKIMPNVFKSIMGKASGAPFFNYITMNPLTKMGDMELCVPTEEIPNSRGVEVKVIPAFKALCVTHFGPYETLNKAYEAIDKYAQQEKIKISAPFREVYIKGPGMIFKGNPDKYITEIVFPIEEE